MTTNTKRKRIDAAVTVSWLLTDTMWAAGLGSLAFAPATVLLLSQIASIWNAPRSRAFAETAVLCWAAANVSWMWMDMSGDLWSKVTCALSFAAAWTLTLTSMKSGLVKRGGKYWN
jgi:hypothetical protein